MSRLILITSLLIALTGCSQKSDQQKSAALESKVVNQTQGALARYLAYEHAITIEASEQNMATLFQTIQQTCQEASADACTILSASIESNRQSGAELKFRAKPEGIKKLIASIGKQGEITGQSTRAEDLEAPLADAAKKIAMLKDYRAKLEELSARKGVDVDSLIKLNKELAQVQSDLESVSGKQAFLNQRIETEILNVSIVSHQNLSFWNPIKESILGFSGNLSQGISGAIMVIAFLVPWLILFAVPAWLIRKFLKRRKAAQSS